ncbi:MAG: hypothetical protein ACE5MH_09455 [Terriglobia bacterium]
MKRWHHIAVLLVALALFARSTAVAAGSEQTRSSSTPPARSEQTAEQEKPPLPAPAPAPPQPARRPGLFTEPQLFFEWRYSVNGTDLKGNKQRSFLHEGINHIFELNTRVVRPVWDVRSLETVAVFRYTDNPRVDPERNSLQRGYLRLAGPSFEMTLGDALVSYSRFSFSQNIKGLNVWKNLPVGAGLKLTGTAGVFTDRWGALFRDFTKFTDPRLEPDPSFPSKPYTRVVLGLRGEQRLNGRQTLAFNYSQGSDVIRSLPPEAQIRAINNQVVSVDTNLSLTETLRLAGEFAYSFTQGEGFDARTDLNKRGDYAGRLEVSQRWQRLNWRVDYARFMPRFFSANARQVQDLQDVALRGSYDLSDWLSVQAAFRRTNDNLRGDKVDALGAKQTTVVRSPELRFTLRHLPFSQRLLVDFGYRERRVETSNQASFSEEEEPLFRDRVTRMPFIDLTLPFGSTLFNLGYEYRLNRDRALLRNSTFTHRVVAGYRASYYWGRWVLLPFARYETEREAKQLEFLFEPTLVTIPGADQTRSLQGGFDLEFPRYLVLRAYYRELNALLLSPFDVGDERFFGNGGYRRPSFRAELEFKIANDENKRIILSLERNVNTFRLADPIQADTRSFRENLVQITFLFRLRR